VQRVGFPFAEIRVVSPWVAAPPRERKPGVARRAAVSVSWPSSHECKPRTGLRPRGGTQSQRTLARARVGTDAAAGGKATPPRGRVVCLREATDPFSCSPGLVGLLGHKWHPGPSGSSRGPVHLLESLSEIQGGSLDFGLLGQLGRARLATFGPVALSAH
jgi:hypothetical protein